MLFCITVLTYLPKEIVLLTNHGIFALYLLRSGERVGQAVIASDGHAVKQQPNAVVRSHLDGQVQEVSNALRTTADHWPVAEWPFQQRAARLSQVYRLEIHRQVAPRQ